MPRDSNGNFSLIPGINPVVPGTVIEADWANPTLADIAAALSDSLSRSGSGGMLVPMRFQDGTRGAPGISWVNAPTSGWYRAGTNDFRYAINGEDIFIVTDQGMTLADGLEAVGFGGFINVQDDEPLNMQEGEEWYESDTGAYYMRYVNPDNTETLIALGAIGGDFVPYEEKGQPNGVATLDGAGKVPVAQLPPIDPGLLPPEVLTEAEASATYAQLAQIGVAGGIASLDAGGTVPDAQIPAGIARDSEIVAAMNAHTAAPDPHPGYLTPAEGAASYEPLGAVAAHVAAPDPHSQYLTPAEGNAAYEAIGAVAAHVAAADPHTGYQREIEKGAANGYASLDAGGKVPSAQIPTITAGQLPPEALTEAEAAATYIPLTQRGAANGVATLDAGSLIPDAQIPAGIARDAEVTAALNAHTAAADPHPGYLTPAEGNAAYEALGAVAAHAAAADPHTGYQRESEKGQPNGYAELDGTGKVPAVQLPAFVDDVQEFANLAAFPVTGSVGIIYVALDTNKTYRWSGSAYIEISPSPGSSDSVPEGSVNLYYTTARQALKADLASPTFTGDPKAPTPTAGDNDTSIATTAFVTGAIATHAAAADPHTGYQKESEKGVANGYASLDAGGTIPDAQIPAAIARDTEVTAAIAAHAGAADPHPTYMTSAEVDASIATHAGAADPHTGYQKESEKGVANGYAALDAGGTVPDAQIPAAIARDAEVTAAINAHAAAADPHPTYMTSAEVDASIAAHAAAADPHTGYQKESEKGLANGYASLDSGGKVPAAQMAGGPLNMLATGTQAGFSVVPTGNSGLAVHGGGSTWIEAASTSNGYAGLLIRASASGVPYSSCSLVQDYVTGTLQLRTNGSNNLDLGVGGGSHWRVNGSGAHLYAVADNANDFGAVAANRPRSGYFGTSIVAPLLNLAHRTAPGSPANGDAWTTTAGIFARINGATIGPLIDAAALTAHEAAADPHPGYQRESEKAAANGYASLDATGKVPAAQLPATGGGGSADAVVMALALG